MNIKSLALTLVAAALLTPAAAFAAEPIAASFDRAFGQSAETPRVAAPAVHAGDAADALTVAFNQALWTRQAPAHYVSPAPVVASFERAFGLPAETPRVAASAMYAGVEVDALTVAFNQVLWTRQAPATLPRYVSSTADQETKRN